MIRGKYGLALIIYTFSLIFLCFVSGCTAETLPEKEFTPTAHLNLPVIEIRDEYTPYKEFCLRNLGECDMTGKIVVEFTPQIKKLLSAVNTAVNHEIQFALDVDEYQKEEFWTYPHSGRGDCEDVALEKRARLTKLGVPRGAMRIALGYNNKTLVSHGMLLVETTQGTYIMNCITDQIFLWYQSPYNYESRERPDGKWDRFDQSYWTFH